MRPVLCRFKTNVGLHKPDSSIAPDISGANPLRPISSSLFKSTENL